MCVRESEQESVCMSWSVDRSLQSNIGFKDLKQSGARGEGRLFWCVHVQELESVREQIREHVHEGEREVMCMHERVCV